MGRILSIDYGKRRTGLAVTDPLRLIANPLETVPTASLLAYLQSYCVSEDVEQIVIGRPTMVNGQPSENLKRVEAFAKLWKTKMPSIPIYYYDERFTSVLAHQAIIDSGVRKKVRRTDKGLVDKISAAIILEDYLKSQGR